LSLPPNVEISRFVKLCIDEDVGSGDLTADLIPDSARANAKIISREQGIICGAAWVDEVFIQLDREIRVSWHVADGEMVTGDQVVCKIHGAARSILTGERTALNLLQTLSGTATLSHHYAELVSHTNARVLDTRKTIPGMRNAQKYAVRCGGSVNHRMGLYDGILIKENHLRSGDSIAQVIEHALDAAPVGVLLEVEVENLDELVQVLRSDVTRVLLDNFSQDDLRRAVALSGDRVELEASGGITEQNIAAIAETGVNYISIGALTKNVKALDFSLLFDFL
jgi:nicotinate-nucleotide pyrophosphorylase (carboxylating)